MLDELEVLAYPPYTLRQAEKEKVLFCDLRAALAWHSDQSEAFGRLCKHRGFDPREPFLLKDIPYVPVTIFKSLDLISVSQKEIIRTLYSSATSGRPSKIMLDQVTASRQVRALNKILSDFLGSRRHFFIFDTKKTVESREGELSSRGTAIRGMLSMAKSITFLLNDDLELNEDAVLKMLEEKRDADRICYFGFTWLLYRTFTKNKDRARMAELWKRFADRDPVALHMGGWKKLKDLAVSKQEFSASLERWLQTPHGRVIDVYGMTEQLGTVYPDCEYGHKHAPAYSEILIRDVTSLAPVKRGEVGFIQFVSPIPRSYPGVSILSDDLGRMMGVDDCPCGRMGTYFVFEKRSEKAEVKGCGDTLNV
ncbi:hypothetical protein A3B32_03520 [Candidatus Uhrbacteria bacterium RIFCSPLOWO2_01_FULL_53_9]|uniref:Acyl-protein synthetase LuxE domain-containing protein n=2 Tax=Candidatus Uhriibacteriota TaxID=1752732 RepID=A0A1F7UYT7_9BACT|nr:MAG: hypothetical protein A3B32_03520 [Candidatus Uhrbacteria bacterium RIFCSPLOWO2_01_FULL_53_9]OGL89759.1 MAG: hypothetical protein A3I45_04035 [Candidatus Uhrbacteria bacterium RIFCSPLOWO2_02_FULL_53_10]